MLKFWKGLVAGLFVLCSGFSALELSAVDAGATGFPTMTGSITSPNYYGECNTVYDVAGGGIYANLATDGVGVQMSCNIALPNGEVPDTVGPGYPTTGFTGNGGTQGTSADISTAGSNCNTSSPHMSWIGGVYGMTQNSGIGEYCTSGSATTVENCIAYGCTPPSVFGGGTIVKNGEEVQSVSSMQYQNMGPAQASYTAWSIRIIRADLVWGACTTVGSSSCVVSGGTTEIAFDFLNSFLAPNCTGTAIHSSPVNGALVFYLRTGGTPAAAQLGSEESATCQVNSFAWPPFPTDIYTGGSNTSASTQPCTLTGETTNITGDTIGKTGVDYPVTFSFTGGATDIVVDPGDNTSMTLHGQSFASDASVDTTPTTPDTISVTPTVGSAYGTYQDWCYSPSTGWVSWGNPISGDQVSAGPGGGNGTGCLATSGMSLSDPVSWVTGIWNVGVCELTALFEPSSASVNGLLNQFGLGTSSACSGTSAATVTQWFGCVGQAFTVAPAADVATMKTAVDGGSCSGVSGSSANLVVAGVTLNGCTLAADSTSAYYSSGATSMLSWFALLLTASVYVFTALLVIHYLRKVLGGAESE